MRSPTPTHPADATGSARPAGRRQADRVRLARILRERCSLRGEFRLASGEISPVYFDCKRATLDPEGLHLVADLMLDLVDDLRAKGTRIDAVGGPSVGADPILAGMAVRSYQRGAPLPAFLIRSKVKDHGTGRYIENDIPAGASVLLVEDVVTSAGSVRRALDRVVAAGLEVAAIACIVDRERGGEAALTPHPLHALFTRTELEAGLSPDPTTG
ncbi:MAG: orotate phosphoribosyltransferase [Acidobacteriota bacterium]